MLQLRAQCAGILHAQPEVGRGYLPTPMWGDDPRNKRKGGWKSDAVFEYLKASLKERLARNLRVATILSARV